MEQKSGRGNRGTTSMMKACTLLPLYEYRCKECEERFEQLVPLRAEHPPVTCPRCGTQEIRKLLSTLATTESNRLTSQSSCALTGG